MAEPVVSFVLETITKLLIEEKNLLSGVSDEAEKLRSELQRMQAFLRDADKKQHDEALVKVCVSQCRNLAYEAENVLEDYAFKFSSRRGKHGISSIVKRFACILNECLIRHNVGSEIQGLNTRISNLTQSFKDYGINALTQGEGSSSGQQQLTRRTYPYVANEDDIVGIEGDIKKLVEIMVKDDFGVVSITGMGGCGKTTLARKVYNHPDVKSHFDSFAWVCVSQQWKTRNLLQEILVSFLPGVRHEIQDWRDGEIVEKLVRLQQEERKCLLVIDDIWTSEAWENIKPAFPLNKKGNKILITTRNRDVATHIGPNGYDHQPRLLDDDESLELLLKKALGNTASPELEDNENLKQLGREMVRTCGGLPLAVVILGGILATKHSSTEWKEVSKNIRTYLGKGERIQDHDDAGVHRILSLSYNDLPSTLKPCFLYLSVLSEDERIDENLLYNLWIAEGMVFVEDRMGRDESIREVAGRYLGELAKRYIVMVEEDYDVFVGRYTTCYLHDLMRDFCRAKAREENFMKVIDEAHGHDGMENSFSEIPRVMINLMSGEDASKRSPVRIESSGNLRALGFRSAFDMDLIPQVAQLGINKFLMLRSLIIEGVEDPVVERVEDVVNRMPSYRGFKVPIGKLIHLRQLSVRRSSLFLSPTSVSNLEHLEILDLFDSRIIWTKKDAIRTRRLKYLGLSEYEHIAPVHVQTIYVSKDLEVISGFFPCARFRIKNMSELTNLRQLGLIYIKDQHDVEDVEDMFMCILNSRHLKDVRICDDTDDVLSKERGSTFVRQLFGSSHVQSILLIGRLSSFTLPLYDSHFSASLEAVTLNHSLMEEDPMKILEKFPNLQNLELEVDAFTGEEMVCHSTGFPQLRSLKFHALVQLKKWIVEKGAMPNLSRLKIISCRNLTALPEELRFISSLKELWIDNMPAEFVQNIAVNFCHVPSIVVT